jgi:hypothetical protein
MRLPVPCAIAATLLALLLDVARAYGQDAVAMCAPL